jgi:hypothetical protein
MYTYVQNGTTYSVMKNDRTLLSRGQVVVSTTSEKLAVRLVADLNEYGEDPSLPESVVAYHYPCLDFFAKVPREDLEENVALGLEKEYDWTFQTDSFPDGEESKYIAMLGTYSKHRPLARNWLSGLDLTQLCAVCVIGRTFSSVNLPFVLIKKSGLMGEGGLESIEALLSEMFEGFDASRVDKCISTFKFYFGLSEVT